MRFRDQRSSWPTLRGRRLLFEELERRDLLAVMRIVDWNTLNGPNDTAGDANFQTILQAIGNETVQGNTERVDILALQETDPPGGGDSIGRITSVLNSLYPSTTYADSYSPADGGGDSTGFVYDTSSVTLLQSVQIGAGTLTHNVMRGKFQPVGAPTSSIFYVYTTHLKSGTAASDATARGTEAAFLRSDADSLGDGTQVLFVGDFNMHTSTEAGYTNLVASGSGQLQDVADAPGDWNNNPAFKNLHSQDPRTSMDDRFDIQFATGELFDGVGVDYVSNSFHVFGNNGTHTLGQPITTGTGASTTVLNALVAASDHLPAVADYQVVSLVPNVRISETLGGTKVVEGGLYDTYQVVLDTVPTANVTITVAPNSQVDVGNGAGVAKQFTFTPANALTPQTVVVHAFDDAIGEGDHSGLITHASASADAAYNGLLVASVNVSIVDNDAPKIVINEIDSDTPTMPGPNDSLEFVELYDGGVGNFSLTGYVVVLYDGGPSAGSQNNTSYKTFDLAGKQTNADGFFLLGNSLVSPTPGITFANTTLQNGPDAVALYFGVAASSIPDGTSPTAPVLANKLKDAIVYDTDDFQDTVLQNALTPGQPQINENENGQGDVQSISRIPDAGTPFNTSSYVEQGPTPGALNQTHIGVQMIQSAGRIDVQEGGATDTYQLALNTIPTANVQITVTPDGQTNLGAGPGAAIVLTFTPANALIPQTITVTSVDDAVVEGPHTSVITHSVASADSHYNGLAVSNVIANIVDNDLPPPTSIVISELMYDPASDETAPGVGEWIEVVNTGTAATNLSSWLFDDEDATNWGPIPSGTVLNPNQVAVFFDSDFTTAATFRSEWSVPANSLVVGITWGSLANHPTGPANPPTVPGDEVLTLYNNVNVPMDVVNYDDNSPWPSDSEGHSIYLKNLSADNNNGANWARSLAGTTKVVSPTGPTFSALDIGSPGRFYLAGDYNANAFVDAADFVMWRKSNINGPTGYTDFRTNFGSEGATSAAVLGTADLATATSLSEPSLIESVASLTPSPPQQSIAVDKESAVDTAMLEIRSAFETLPLPPGEDWGEGESAAANAPSPSPIQKGEGFETASGLSSVTSTPASLSEPIPQSTTLQEVPSASIEPLWLVQSSTPASLSEPILQSAALQEAPSSSIELLWLDQSASQPRPADDSPAAFQVADQCPDAVDELFASLDKGDLAAEIGWLSPGL